MDPLKAHAKLSDARGASTLPGSEVRLRIALSKAFFLAKGPPRQQRGRPRRQRRPRRQSQDLRLLLLLVLQRQLKLGLA